MSRALLTALLAVLVIAIGATDVLSGPEFGFALFYLAPIAYAAMRLGPRSGLVLALESFAAWAFAEIVNRDASAASFAWNALTRLVIFCGTAVLLSALERDRVALQVLAERRREFAQLLGSDLRVLSATMLGDAAPGVASVDLVAVVRHAVAATDSARVELAGDDGAAPVRADGERLEHAVVSMLSSALRRTRGDVWLAVRDRDGDVGVEVTARADGWVASADDDADLLTARLVAHLYDGRVALRQGDAGTTVSLVFPRAG